MDLGSWEDKKWALLASIIVVGGLYALMWYLVGGCQPSPKPGLDADGRPDPVARAVQALNDPNILEVSLQVAWFRTGEGRLPESLDEVRRALQGRGWPLTPATSSRGQPLTYRATGDRTYDLGLPGPDKTPATEDDLLLPMAVPENLPTDLTPEVLRAWWEIHHLNRALGEMKKALDRQAPPPDGAPASPTD